MTDVRIPADLLPADGRFGSGPSKVRQDAVQRLAAAAPSLLGTSHRRPAVKDLVARARRGLRELFALPEGYEVVLGNGGASLFWDAAVHGLIERRSAHAVLGEFSAKFATAVAAAPFLDDPVLVEAAPGTAPTLEPVAGVDAYAFPHCETSTGVAMPVRRPGGGGLVLVDATSAAGSLAVDPSQFDAYYFSPQKGFGSEGGLWIALLSPDAIARVGALRATGRYVPRSLDLTVALDQSSSEQTENTPSISTLFLLADQVEWILGRGGLGWAAASCAEKAAHLYGWAASRRFAEPFVQDPELRSDCVVTLDLDRDVVSADEVSAVLRAHGIVDTEAYRKLGRNQLRIAVFPAVELADVEALTACLDHVVDALATRT